LERIGIRWEKGENICQGAGDVEELLDLEEVSVVDER